MNCVGYDIRMDTSRILSAIDAQLAQLQAARAAITTLASTGSSEQVRRGPGRPPKNPLAAIAAAPKKRKNKLSAAGRARIAAAMKARWAAKKAISAAPAKAGKKAAKKATVR